MTKTKQPSRTPDQIREQIKKLYEYAKTVPDKDFIIPYTVGGKNLNFYTDKDMAQFFAAFDIPDNIVFEHSFSELVKKSNIKNKGMETTMNVITSNLATSQQDLPLYDKLKTFVEKKGYVFFDTGDFNLNIIFNRTSNVFTDHFTDIMYVAYRENGEKKTLSIPATTKAGSYYVQHPITYQGVTGVAVIAPGQYRGVYQFVDDYVTWLNYPFFRQTKGMNYYRDFDKDNTLDEVQYQKNQIFGTHIHRMSNPGVTGQTIYNWSAGCMGAEEPNFKQILPLARAAVKTWGNSFTCTIMEAKDFV